MFNLRQDCLYDPNATIVYPSNSGISPTQFNQRDGLTIINPKENCGFMLTFDIQQFLGSTTQSSNIQGMTIKFGNLDLYSQASTSSNTIQYYELVLSNSATPVLRFYHPDEQQFSELILQGSALSLGVNRVYVHFVGNILTIGFNENTYNWNTISAIEPNENETFSLLYHVIPGGRTDPQIDSGIQIDFNNVSTYFKYSGIAFKNIISSTTAPQNYDFFNPEDNADPYKKTFTHQATISTLFLKQISQTTRLEDFFHAKGLRLYERINGTPQYNAKINSIYGFNTEILSPTTQYNFSNISFARDWRMQDPYASDFNNCDPWEIKVTLTDPNYDPINSGDNALAANMQLNIVFDSPVYSPVFLNLDTSNMPVSDITLSTSTSLNADQVNSLSALQDTTINDLLVTSGDSYQLSTKNPVFYFAWGNITDLIENGTISINHAVDVTTGVAGSNTTLTINNLAYSTRGSNILNYIENNLTVIQIAAGYPEDNLDDLVYFEGVITQATTTVSPIHSSTNLTCKDWLTYVMANTLAGTTVALQGNTIRNVVNIALNLAALTPFTSYLSQSQDPLPVTTDNPPDSGDPCEDADTSLITALNFIVGNASAQATANTLAQQIQITDELILVIQGTLPFIVNDLSIPVLYQNVRNESVAGTPQRSALVIENRYLSNCVTTRQKDAFKFLVSPSNGSTEDGSILIEETNGVQQGSFFNFGLSNSKSEFHGTIMTDLVRISQPQNLYEGVYLFGQGLGNVPIYEVRSSDSYFTTNSNLDGTDAWLYATALNRAISDNSTGNVPINVLDEINQTDYNNENNIVTAWNAGNRFAYGYVGFRKRFVDDNSTIIQTAQDLQHRGDLYAQYIRKVVQTLSFTALVTRPLQHYNNFYIDGLQSTTTDPFTAIDQSFTRTEYTNFLYTQVNYQINKQQNIITANVQGSTVPAIGSIYYDGGAGSNANQPT